LPLDSDSVDAIIAHHCLEFAASPHQVLREIQRVLTPRATAGGRLQPVWPVSKTRLRGVPRPFVSRHHPVREHRLTDWLHCWVAN
jgi:ubiquinone/menaquinone biosynthesis C-methylase UbiE